jgi:hypothetical protein
MAGSAVALAFTLTRYYMCCPRVEKAYVLPKQIELIPGGHKRDLVSRRAGESVATGLGGGERAVETPAQG